MSSRCGVAVIGAGPYGLSLAAHLTAHGGDFRIFGNPMVSWTAHMPRGMLLKSEGFASNLDGPQDGLTLGRFSAESNLPYKDIGLPVPVETFASYGLAFQKRFVPSVENKEVLNVAPTAGGFDITLADDERLTARNVVVATGINQYRRIPAELAKLPPEILSHTADHADLSGFRNRSVVVVGAGSSAIDTAGILHRHGAKVTIVARTRKLIFHEKLGERSPYEKIRYPMTGLGPSWRSFLCVHCAPAFRALPEDFRLRFVRTHLGPEAGWFARADVDGKVLVKSSSRVVSAKTRGGQVELTVKSDDGADDVIVADNIIAGTGYEVDVDRIAFLDRSIRASIKRTGKAPALSTHFESTVPGLYFVGAPAVNSFGPLLRFVYGARFTARRLTPRLVRTTRAFAAQIANVPEQVTGASQGG